MVEINPTLDKENLMAENAFEILQKATNQLNNDFQKIKTLKGLERL